MNQPMTPQKRIDKYLLNPIAYIQVLMILILLLSPFAWMWIDFTAFWKVALSGFIGALIFTFIYTAINKISKKVTDDSSQTIDFIHLQTGKSKEVILEEWGLFKNQLKTKQ